MHHLEDVNGILKLEDHIVVCPVALAILTVFKEYQERRLITCEGGFVRTSENLNGSFSVSVLFVLALEIDFIQYLLTNYSHEAMFTANECRYHGSNSFILRE